MLNKSTEISLESVDVDREVVRTWKESGHPAALLAVVLLCADLVLQLTKGKITEICLVLG